MELSQEVNIHQQPGIDLTTVVSVGDEMKAKVLKLNDGEGQVLLTYRKLVAESGSKRA